MKQSNQNQNRNRVIHKKSKFPLVEKLRTGYKTNIISINVGKGEHPESRENM